MSVISKGPNVTLLDKEHITTVTSFLNNIPKTRIPLSKNKFTTEIVSNFVDNKNFIFYVIEIEKQCSGFVVCKDIDWINRKCLLYSFVNPDINNFDAELYGISFVSKHCFYNLGFNKIISNIISNDVYLKKIYEKAGFSCDVQKRNHFFANGNYHHVSEMSLLASDFFNERN